MRDTRPAPKTDNEIWTPPDVTDQIIPFIPSGTKRIWECCYGEGYMAERLREHGYSVKGNVEEDAREVYKKYRRADAIITNPPFENKLRVSILKSVLLLDKPTAFIIRLAHIGGVAMSNMVEEIKPNRFQFIIPSRRMNFVTLSGAKNCMFHSIWLTYKFNLEQDIIFI